MFFPHPLSSQKYSSDRFWFFTIIHQFIYCLHLNFTSVCNSSNFMKLNLLTVLCTISILQIGLQPVSQFTQIIHIQFLPLSADCFLILHEAPLSIRMLQSQLAVKCHPVHIPATTSSLSYQISKPIVGLSCSDFICLLTAVT